MNTNTEKKILSISMGTVALMWPVFIGTIMPVFTNVQQIDFWRVENGQGTLIRQDKSMLGRLEDAKEIIADLYLENEGGLISAVIGLGAIGYGLSLRKPKKTPSASQKPCTRSKPGMP